MSWEILKILPKILPFRLFKETRDERKKIKAVYQNNKSRLDRGNGDVEYRVGSFDTTCLGSWLDTRLDEREWFPSPQEKHYETQALVQDIGNEPKNGFTGRGAGPSTYMVPAEHKEEVRNMVEEVIEDIDRRNGISLLGELGYILLLLAGFLLWVGILP
jgi:hypothetical protein